MKVLYLGVGCSLNRCFVIVAFLSWKW